MKVKDYLKSVDKQLVNIRPKEKKKILTHLQKKLKKFLRKTQEKAVVDKLGDPIAYGKALNRHYKIMKTANDIRLILPPINGNGGNRNGKRNFLKEMKFIISADMIMPVPTYDFWILGGISLLLLALFAYALFVWNMWIMVWILFPAFIANSAALFSKRIKLLNPLAIPIDLGENWYDRRRIIGNSKTVRGFIFGIASAMASAAIVFFASEYFGIVIFSSLNYALLIAFVLGFGALLGDTVKSFFKRRVGLKEGKNLLFFDQLDFLIGAFLFSIPFRQFPVKFILLMATATFVAHVLTNVVAFYMRIKKVPW